MHIRQAIRSHRANGRHKEADELEAFLAGPEGNEDPPEDAAFVWGVFLQCNGRRVVSSGMGGVVLSPISHEDITAWERGNGTELTPWERMVVSRIDDLYLDMQRKQIAAQAAKNAKKK